MTRTIILFFLSLLLVGGVTATSLANVYSPVQGSTITADRQINFRVMVDDDSSTCFYQFGLTNGSTYNNGSTTNFTAQKNGRDFNYTFYVPFDSAPGSSHNYSVYCGATTATATLAGTVSYRLNTRTPIIIFPVDGATYNTSLVSIQATTNTAVNLANYTCRYRLGLTNGTQYGYVQMNASDTTNTTFVNGSVLPRRNSTNAAYHNLTVQCEDGSGNLTSAITYFQVDEVDPVVTTKNSTVLAGIASLNASVADVNPSTCTITVNGTSITATRVGTGTTSYCVGSYDGSIVPQDGAYQVQYGATDASGRTATVQNQSAVKKTLYQGWNIISFPIRANLSTACAMVSGCTQVSWLNNTDKTFTTYSTSAPTVNDGFVVAPGWAIMVYVPTTTSFIADDFLPVTGAGSATENVSLVTGWNLVGLTQSANLSTILAADVDNITFASSVVNNVPVICSNNSLCAGGTTGALVRLPKGSAAWIHTNGNFSLNRSTVTT